MTGQPSGWGPDFIRGRGQAPLAPPTGAGTIFIYFSCVQCHINNNNNNNNNKI